MSKFKFVFKKTMQPPPYVNFTFIQKGDSQKTKIDIKKLFYASWIAIRAIHDAISLLSIYVVGFLLCLFSYKTYFTLFGDSYIFVDFSNCVFVKFVLTNNRYSLKTIIHEIKSKCASWSALRALHIAFF